MWSEETQLAILNELSCQDISQFRRDKRTIDSKLDTFTHIEFPIHHKWKYIFRAQSIKQASFVFIKNYYDEISTTVANISFCQKISSREMETSIEDAFMLGLVHNTQCRMLEIGKSSSKETLKLITTIEEQIRENMCSNEFAWTENLAADGVNALNRNYKK